MKKAFKLACGIVLTAVLIGSVCAFSACGNKTKSYTMTVDDVSDYIDMIHEGEIPMIHFNYIYGNGIAWQYQSITEIDYELTLDDGTYTLVETVWSSKDSTSAQYYVDEYTATGSYTAVSDTEYTLAAATSVVRNFAASDNFLSQGVFGNTGETTMTNEYNCPGCTATIDNSDMSVSFSDSTAKYVDVSDVVEEEETVEDVVIEAGTFTVAEDGKSATLAESGYTLTFKNDGTFTGTVSMDIGGTPMEVEIIYGKWSISGNFITYEKYYNKKDESGQAIENEYETKDSWKITATSDEDSDGNTVYGIAIDPTGAYTGSGYTYLYYTEDNASTLANLLSSDSAEEEEQDDTTQDETDGDEIEGTETDQSESGDDSDAETEA